MMVNLRNFSTSNDNDNTVYSIYILKVHNHKQWIQQNKENIYFFTQRLSMIIQRWLRHGGDWVQSVAKGRHTTDVAVVREQPQWTCHTAKPCRVGIRCWCIYFTVISKNISFRFSIQYVIPSVSHPISYHNGPIPAKQRYGCLLQTYCKGIRIVERSNVSRRVDNANMFITSLNMLKKLSFLNKTH